MKKTVVEKVSLVILSAFVVSACFVTPALAETKEEKLAAKVKAGITKLGTGENAKVSLKLKDGTKIKGYVRETNADHFVVVRADSTQPVVVQYPQVKQAKGNNLSDRTAIIIGVGVAILAIILLANALD